MLHLTLSSPPHTKVVSFFLKIGGLLELITSHVFTYLKDKGNFFGKFLFLYPATTFSIVTI